MNTITLSWGNFALALTSDASRMAGVGGPSFPRLLIPLDLHFYELKDHELTYQGISAQLCTVDGRTIADAAAKPFVYNVRATFPAQHQLEFALSHPVLEQLEELRGRNSQSMFLLRLDIQVVLQIRKITPGKDDALSQGGLHPLSGSLPLEIPISVWCEKIAAGLGIGLIRVFELPAVPLSEVESYDRAYQSILKAQRWFSAGEYDDAVAECRKAIEPIRQHLQGRKLLDPSILAADYADKVGQSTLDWLTTVLGKTHGVSSELHHSSKAHFNRLDAQMVLTITLSLVAYVLRTNNNNSEKHGS